MRFESVNVIFVVQISHAAFAEHVIASIFEASMVLYFDHRDGARLARYDFTFRDAFSDAGAGVEDDAVCGDECDECVALRAVFQREECRAKCVGDVAAGELDFRHQVRR